MSHQNNRSHRMNHFIATDALNAEIYNIIQRWVTYFGGYALFRSFIHKEPSDGYTVSPKSYLRHWSRRVKDKTLVECH